MKDGEKSLSELSAFLEDRLSRPLPGPEAHTTMIPSAAGNIKFRYKTALPRRQGSVLILLYEDEGGLYFPLIKRPVYKGVHSGQISLPGGKAEPGESPTETAIREAEEEIGIDRRKVTTIGKLTGFTVTVSEIFITPVVGIYAEKPAFKPDPREVDKVLTFSLRNLLQLEEIPSREIIASGGFPLVAPHFEIDDEMVWGATAMVLNELRMVLRQA